LFRRVVITGIGVISPIGIGAKAFWDNLLAGKMGVRRIASFDPSGLPAQIAGEVPQFKIGDFVPKSYRKATKVMARDIELAVIAADDAFKDAGLQTRAYTDSPRIDPTRFGCNIGAGLISADLNLLTQALRDPSGNSLMIVEPLVAAAALVSEAYWLVATRREWTGMRSTFFTLVAATFAFAVSDLTVLLLVRRLQ